MEVHVSPLSQNSGRRPSAVAHEALQVFDQLDTNGDGARCLLLSSATAVTCPLPGIIDRNEFIKAYAQPGGVTVWPSFVANPLPWDCSASV